MGTPTKSYYNQDSFLDALRTDAVAGAESLSSWISEVQAQGAIDTLFELEAWLRGLQVFFDLKHLPLREAERGILVARSFAPEISVARLALKECERCTLALCRTATLLPADSDAPFDAAMEERGSSGPASAIAQDQSTPTDSLVALLESINDLKVMIDCVEGAAHQDFQFFLSVGRTLRRDLRHCRYIWMLLEQRFRLQFDRIDHACVSAVLKSIADDRLRNDVALTLLYLFRFLRYLGLVSAALRDDRPLRRFLVLFSLLQEQTETLSQFIKSRFIKERRGNAKLKTSADLILNSLRLETQRVFERELVLLSSEQDASTIYAKIENSNGLLRNCYQSCVLTLVHAFDATVDAKSVFPSMIEGLLDTQKLTADLWDLRSGLQSELEKVAGFDLSVVLERINYFRETSLRYLMYQDWGEFERFSDSLVAAGNEIEASALLRRFITFVEVLSQEVSKRSALK